VTHEPVEPETRQSGEGSGAPDGGTTSPLDAPAIPFLDRRRRERPAVESILVRVIATIGVIAVSVAVAAILGSQGVGVWIIGLVASALSVILAAILWSSRTL